MNLNEGWNLTFPKIDQSKTFKNFPFNFKPDAVELFEIIAITFAETFFLEHLSIIAFKLLPLPDIKTTIFSIPMFFLNN